MVQRVGPKSALFILLPISDVENGFRIGLWGRLGRGIPETQYFPTYGFVDAEWGLFLVRQTLTWSPGASHLDVSRMFEAHRVLMQPGIAVSKA
jgi:hypothetical protein